MTQTNNEFMAEDVPPAIEPEVKQAKAEQEPKKEPKKETKKASDRVTIIVHEPADGAVQQFFGLNGKGFLIRFGEKVTVPRALLNVLNEAVQTKTIPIEAGGFQERDFRRFTYTIVGE